MRPALRPHRLQALNVVLCCALLGATMLPGTYDIVRGFLPAAGYPSFQVAFVAGLVALCLLVTVPLARVYLATNLLVLAGSVFLAAQLVQTYGPATDPVIVASPLEEEWYVAQGGHAELVNYHHVTSTQSNALDIVQVVDGQTHRPGSKDLESYYIYGAPILAPADGVVSSVVDGLRDQPIGSVDDRRDAGNQVVIRVGEDRYIMIGHVRAGSIRVSVGDRVAAGQVIAEVGNSGNTDEPHVHIQAQNLPSLDDDAEDPVELVRALRTYPLVFDDVVLTRDGSESTPSVADPRRGDLVRPAR
jgi:murein DD-endopeptidase MepM/ murein hydrolase activator NlpD